MRRALAAVLAAALLAAGCRVEVGSRGAGEGDASGASGTTVHVYTSMYAEVVEAVEPVLLAELALTSPGTTVSWFQSGSEKVAQRLDAELTAGGSPCDVLLVSDPAYYERLKAKGLLVPYVSPAALRQPRELIDPDGAFATARVSTMVIGLSKQAAAREGAPGSFADLAKPSSGRVALGDPLSSGTFFTTVSVLAARLGWDYFRALEENGAVAAGGNSTVLQRLETGESDAGIVLMENLLAARRRGSQVAIVIPTDGAVPVPGFVALLPHAARSLPARAVVDALLSPAVQRVVVDAGLMHSPDPALPPPEGAPRLEDILRAHETSAPPRPADEVRATFDEIFFR